MTPERIEDLEQLVRERVDVGSESDEADLLAALALAKSAIPIKKLNDSLLHRVSALKRELDRKSETETRCALLASTRASLTVEATDNAARIVEALCDRVAELKDAGTALMKESNARLDRAERAESRLNESEAKLEEAWREAAILRRERDWARDEAAAQRRRADTAAAALTSATETPQKKLEALEHDLLLHFEAKNAALAEAERLRGQLQAAHEDLERTAKRAEEAERLLGEARSRIDTREADVWRKRVEAAADALADVLQGETGRLNLLARIAELRRQRDEARRAGNRLASDVMQWEAKARDAEARCARLSAAGQVLSEHVDKTAGGTLGDVEVARNAMGMPDMTPESRAVLAERRAERVERALRRAGFEDHGGEEWAPPVGGASRHPGWTMRDEFAKAAMQGMAARIPVSDAPDRIAVVAYLMADSMMRAREGLK